MRTINFTNQEISEVLDAVVGMLVLGNVEFEENDFVTITQNSKEYFAKCAELFKVDIVQLLKALTVRVSVIGGDKIE